MSTAPPNPSAEKFAAYVRWLVHVVVTRDLVGLLAKPVANHLIDRLRIANQRFRRLAARVQAGTWRPRRIMARQPAENPKPRPKIPRRQKFGWLRPLLPDAVPAAGHLEFLFQDPEIIALMQAAPAQMARILRPLCWMLRIKPPPILARPRPKPTPGATPPPAPTLAPTEAATPRPPAPRPPLPPPRTPSRSRPPARPVPPRACGPPRPA